MDVSGFLGGRFLNHGDLPAQSQIWTICQVVQQTIRSETKICVLFDQHQKRLPLNKTNLNVIANGYGVLSEGWIGRPLEIYRDKTLFDNSLQDCVRVRVPQPMMQTPQPATAYQTAQVPRQVGGVNIKPGTTSALPSQLAPQPVLPTTALPPAGVVLPVGLAPASPQSPQPRSVPNVPNVPWAQ